ncbi:sensor histidine kinase [Priestia flexa]|uniref:sensor histidine kinase n=1 Tax=Priestia flexa TaxID=86664 RepID=UPI00077C3300|nr:ATP-binding protein [Priestia flexa]MEC0667586.1 ATP-binding protein [Priestia flexa]MED3823761.1 ATP-binding protein [Priestia flexa]MED4587165.1 ATP-binding protein [Priestia flexa]
MKNVISKLSFRSKILSSLLVIALLLSSLSFIFVYSIDDLSVVSQKLKDEEIPELVWLSYWEEELHVKQYIVSNNLDRNDCCTSVVTEYKQYRNHAISRVENDQVAFPASLQQLKEQIQLLDFQINNNVAGLIAYEDQEAAATYLDEVYLPQLYKVQAEIQDQKKDVSNSLGQLSGDLPLIIRNALIGLLISMVVIVFLSILISYRMSRMLTKPVESMTARVDRIADGEYGLRLEEEKQIEFLRLSKSINKMSQNLSESFHKITAEKTYREQILNSLPVGIITVDHCNNHLFLNAAVKKMLMISLSDVQHALHHEGNDNEAFWRILREKKVKKHQKVTYQLNQEERCLLVSQSQLVDDENNVVGRIFHFIDITDTEQLECRMHQTEKLALVGELAAGAAHEIRNPLAVIHGFLSLMNHGLSVDERKSFQVELLLKELERINSIVEEMLMLAKPRAPVMKAKRIDYVLEEIISFITANNQAFTIQVEMEKAMVWIDDKQIKQVVHNLLRNSIEAMGGAGRMEITGMVKRNQYCIYLKDSGTGIPKEVQKSIFYPFTTSKENGTGLGLTIVKTILQNHGGDIELVETSEKGTTFMMTLPIN